MKIILDAEQLNTPEPAQSYLMEKFDFPSYYGKNLDALFDCLMEMKDIEIHFEHVEAAGAYFKKLLRVFKEASEENPSISMMIDDFQK